MKTTGKYSQKRFKCARCGFEQLAGTNHWGEFYDRCTGCSWKNPMDPIVTWKCLEPMPEGFEAPAPWTKVKLGDVLEVIDVGYVLVHATERASMKKRLKAIREQKITAINAAYVAYERGKEELIAIDKDLFRSVFTEVRKEERELALKEVPSNETENPT